MVPQIWSVTDRIFCHFGAFFDLLPPYKLKNQNFEKLKKGLGDIIILHNCTKNHDHIHTVPEIWHVTDVIIVFHFALFFALLPLFKKMEKKPGDIITLHMCTKNYDQMMFCC